jgi:hypothetical protein
VVGKGKIKRCDSRLAIALIGSVAVLAALPGGASALPSHLFLGSFCEPTGIGSAPCAPSFVEPEGLAVDQATGEVLVIDHGTGTVSRWHEDGTPSAFSALGTNVIDGLGGGDDLPGEEGLSFGGPAEVQVAVDNSGGATDGNIYVPQFAGEDVVDIFAADGSFLGQLTESSEGELGEPCGVAVDPSGNVYVGDFSGAIHKYEPTASLPENADNSANFPFTANCTLAAGAGATAGSLFAIHYQGEVVKLDSTTGAEQYAVQPGNNTTATVDPASGHLYIASESEVSEYDASGPSEAQPLSVIAAGGARVSGVAVDAASGNVYIAHEGTPNLEVWGPAVVLPETVTQAADPVGAESATLNGSVNPEGLPLTECFFEWGETQAYGNVAPCEEPNATGVGEGSLPVQVHAEISNLKPGTSYHFRLAAANSNGPQGGENETFVTLGAAIKDEAASLITTTSARLSAQVDPNGEAATYVFQYVSKAQFEASGPSGGYAEAISLPSPPGEAGSGNGFIEVGQQLTGLLPDITYVFRLVATTPAATQLGPDKTFTTRPLGADVLPDGRLYEMVSPPQKVGEVFPPEPSGNWTGSCRGCLPGINDGPMPMQATDDGEKVAYEGSPFTGGLAAGPNEYLSQRDATGWSMQSLSTPLFALTVEEQGYKAFSGDLSRAVLSQIEPALSPEAPIGGEGKSYANLYLRNEDGTLEPLVTAEPPQRVADRQSSDSFRIGFAGANAGTGLAAALHHVIFEANDALTDEVPEMAPVAPTISAEERSLYEWVDGELRLVNVAPGNGAAVSGAVFGSGRLLTGEREGSGADVDWAISADGSRIFFSEKATGQVYVRIDGEETRQIEDNGMFLVASADGSKVLLSDGCLYDVDGEDCEADLTQGEGGFEGILGATNDLSRIYLVDTKALTEAGEENENGEHAEEGEFNLYGWDEGAFTFIATLAEGDNEFNGVVEPQVGDWMPSSSSRTAQVSPDGRFLAFMSRAPLTGYDNNVRNGDECRPNEPAPCFEVFEYRADMEKLICVSCNPSGERPLGTSNLSLIRRGKNRVGLAGFPQPTNLTANDGRIFFESQDALTLGDLNGRIKDVYEWEPDGVGGCQRAQGCVYLISNGQGPNDSIFLDATPSGDDAFFITRDRLLLQDADEKLDLYDARTPHAPGEAVGFPESKIAPCEGETCKGPVSPGPPLQNFTSGDVGGPGNVHHRHKKHHRKHHHKKKHKHRQKQGGRR